MKIGFGKHAGKTIELLVLKEPDYIAWMLAQETRAGSSMENAQMEANRLIAMFDRKPYIKKCFGRNCTQTATCCTVYNSNVLSPYWWCDNCSPYQSGASPGKLFVLRTYSEAISHADRYSGVKSDYKSIIRSMAEAKGLPARVGAKQAAQFFAK